MVKSSSKIHDEVIEMGIIGTLIKKPEMYYFAEFVTPSQFIVPECASLFWCVSKLISSGVEVIDDFSIVSKLRENDAVYKIYKESIENKTFYDTLAKLRSVGTTDVAELQRRINRLVTLDFRRRIPLKLREVANNIESNDDDDINTLNGSMHNELMLVSETYLSSKELPMLGDLVDDMLKELQERVTDNGIVGIPFVFPTANKMYFSLESGEMTVVGALQKTGKSQLALGQAWASASNGVPTLVLDSEMPSRQFFERLLSHITHIPVRKIKSGEYDDIGKKKIEDATKLIKSIPLAHHYLAKDGNWGISDIFLLVKSYDQKMGGLGLLIFDYLKVESVSSLKCAEQEFLGDLANALKNGIAGRMNIPILAFAQMDASGSYIANSAKIARYASTICYLKKKTPEEIISDGATAGNYKFQVAYNRLGRQSDLDSNEYISIQADLDVCRFTETKHQPTINMAEIF